MTARYEHVSARDDARAGLRISVIPAVHVAIAVAFRLFCLWRYRIDSDEPQHLHVAWGWTQGFVAYRDFYDNHLPLFHLLFAPLVSAAGETAGILTYARLMMLPLAAASLTLTWLIASRLYGRQIAFWATLLASVFPEFLLKGLEFRNDNLWVAGTLAALLLALGALTPRRTFLLGLLLGATFLVSIKTGPFTAALAVALFAAYGRAITVRMVLTFAAGFAIAPLIAAAFFAKYGALDDLWRCAIAANGLIPVAMWRRVAGAAVFLACLYVVFRFIRDMRRERAIVAATALMLPAWVGLVAPLISPRDILPSMPLAMIFLAALLAPRLGEAMHVAPLVLILFTIFDGDLLDAPRAYDREVIEQTLALTRPGERVLDLKGETIFRERATFVAYEPVGRELVASGAVPDTVPHDVIASRCYVATRDSNFFPPRARSFLREHFVQIGDLRVAGQRVADDGSFSIAIPGEYVVLDGQGRTIAPPHAFAAGRYELPPAQRVPGALVVWRGVERIRG